MNLRAQEHTAKAAAPPTVMLGSAAKIAELAASAREAKEQLRQLKARRAPKRNRPLSRFTKQEESPGFYLSFSDLMCLLLVFFVMIFSLNKMNADPGQEAKVTNRPGVTAGMPLNLPGINPIPGVAAAAPEKPAPIMAGTPKPAAAQQEKKPAPKHEGFVVDRSLFALVGAGSSLPREAAPPKETRLSAVLERVGQEIKKGAVPGMEIESTPNRLVIRLPEAITFDVGRSEIKNGMRPALSRLAGVLGARLGYRVIVTGHTDDVPIHNRQFASNWELSAARAATVGRALLAEGLPKRRLTIRGLADTDPRTPNDSAMGRSLNRRVEIELRPEDV